MLLEHERHEGCALRAHLQRELAAHDRRTGAVVDDHRRGVVVCARDPGRLRLEVDGDVAPPGEVADPAGQQPASRPPFLVDEHEGGELDAEQRRDLVEEDPGGLVPVARAREGVRHVRDGLELTPERVRPLLGLPGVGRPHREHTPLAPARDQQQRRYEGEQRGREGGPDVAAERRTLVEDHGAEDRRRKADAGELERDRDVHELEPPALAPEQRCQRHARREMDGGEHE